ncbi:MAG TPA: HEPN domain-containing protein [Isosphaeraceae bacterium]|jgi:HEPN domain-containing protein|nr:HEPN domain-containing protein [Isosphaeraceae bacterium]
MTEFTKMKISFALALLGTLFALHPFLDPYDDRGFVYLGYNLKILYAYALTAALLSLCVYLYAMTLLSERPHSRIERLGNAVYALAVLIGPIYLGLFLSATLADRVAVSHVAWAAPAVAAGLGMGWVVLSQVVAWRIKHRLGERDRKAKMEQLARHESEALNRARELFEGEHYDLSVVEAYRALEARLRQALLARHVAPRGEGPQGVVHAAIRRGILREPTLGLVEELRRHWNVAVSVEPLPREAAVSALSAVRHVLSVIPQDVPGPGPDRVSTPRPSAVPEPAFIER